MSSKDSSPYDDLKKFFGEVNKALESGLEKQGFSEVYGHFLAAAFLVSLSLGIAASFSSFSLGIVNFGSALIIYTLLISFVIFPVFTYVFVHIYKAFYGKVTSAKSALNWQIGSLSISILLSFVLSSATLVYGGLAVFFIMLFVYPVMEKTKRKKITKKDFNSRMNTIYTLIIFIANLIQVILKLAHMF